MNDDIDRTISENEALIASILNHNAAGNHASAVALLERLQLNLEFIAAAADHGLPVQHAPLLPAAPLPISTPAVTDGTSAAHAVSLVAPAVAASAPHAPFATAPISDVRPSVRATAVPATSVPPPQLPPPQLPPPQLPPRPPLPAATPMVSTLPLPTDPPLPPPHPMPPHALAPSSSSPALPLPHPGGMAAAVVPIVQRIAPAPLRAPAASPAAPNRMYWSPEEHTKFEQAMKVFGTTGRNGRPNFKAIASRVGTRTAKQVRGHLEKINRRENATYRDS